MIRESLEKSVQPSLDGEKLHALVMELDEKAEEALSAGTIDRSGIKYSYIVRWNVSNSTQRS